MSEVEATYDEMLREYPLRVRRDIAQARNAKIRLDRAKGELEDASVKVKAHVKMLARRHQLNPYEIARLLNYSRTRVLTILKERPK